MKLATFRLALKKTVKALDALRQASIGYRATFAGIIVAAVAVKADVSPSHPCPIDADLWLLGGQSNMEGVDLVRNNETPEDPRIVMFDMTNAWVVAKEPVHRLYEAVAPVHRTLLMKRHTRNSATPEAAEQGFLQVQDAMRKTPRGVGPGVAFAQAVLKETGRPIGLIPCAHGGSSMSAWDPALKDKGDHSLYGALLRRVEMIGGGKKIRGILWYQGESDVSPQFAPNYEKNMLALIDSLRRDLEQPDLPIIYVQIGRYVRSPELAVGYETIREVQRRLIQLRPRLYFTTAIDQPLVDPIHLSAIAQQCLGRRLAALALTHVYQRPGFGRQIDLESIVKVNASTIRLHGRPVMSS